MAEPAQIETILQKGGARARALAAPLLEQVRYAIGLRSVAQLATVSSSSASKKRPKLTTFRDSEGFRFKLSSADGKSVLVESVAFEGAKQCGQAMATFKLALPEHFRATDFGVEYVLETEVVANGAVALDQVLTALAELLE